MEEALAWVEYCNGTKDTYYANLRRKNGHPEPYNVKYWALGNEVRSVISLLRQLLSNMIFDVDVGTMASRSNDSYRIRPQSNSMGQSPQTTRPLPLSHPLRSRRSLNLGLHSSIPMYKVRRHAQYPHVRCFPESSTKRPRSFSSRKSHRDDSCNDRCCEDREPCESKGSADYHLFR
jgi:hypothetical protein